MTATADPGDLLTRVGRVQDRIRRLVAARRQDDPDADDPFRGLYLTDEAVDRVLDTDPDALFRLVESLGEPDPTAPCADTPEKGREWWVGGGGPGPGPDVASRVAAGPARNRFADLARICHLDELDVELLVVALTCELDPRFEQLFGYLNDDVTRRRPSVAVALALCGVPLASRVARERLTSGPLIRADLLSLEDTERPFPGRALVMPDRVTAHLLGLDTPEPALQGVLAPVPDVAWGDGRCVASAMRSGTRLIYLREPPTGSGELLAIDALRRLGLRALLVDLDELSQQADAVARAGLVAREARLRGRGIVGRPLSENRIRAEIISALDADPLPLLLVGSASWDPAWAREVPLLVDVPKSTLGERGRLWRGALSEADLGFDPAAATSQFLLRPSQVARAAQAARLRSSLADGQRLTVADVRAGARSENGSALQRLARRVEPAVGWHDLALPVATMTALQEVASRARHREQVLGDWQMRPGGGRGTGVAALFAGDSGTGKTMSAEVVAGDLGLDLYVVDLATVVDKYVGETEKNLDRIFEAAAGVNGVLLFDEADAVFGKRSEVRDAHDRYANVESAFLLQRMETFDGLAILATNLRANIDEAFTRRLDVLVDFPLPDPAHRLLLWRGCLKTLPQSESLDLEFCAEAFELSGGAIRSAAVTAAYLAASAAGPVTMAQVVMAVQREYRKLGRLCVEQEFGRYHALLS